jgi:hypothetical protein
VPPIPPNLTRAVFASTEFVFVTIVVTRMIPLGPIEFAGILIVARMVSEVVAVKGTATAELASTVKFLDAL